MEDDTHVYLRILKDINTPEELLDFMSNNINYGYLGKNGRVYHYDDKDFDSSWYREYILENSIFFPLLFISCELNIGIISLWYKGKSFDIELLLDIF